MRAPAGTAPASSSSMADRGAPSRRAVIGVAAASTLVAALALAWWALRSAPATAPAVQGTVTNAVPAAEVRRADVNAPRPEVAAPSAAVPDVTATQAPTAPPASAAAPARAEADDAVAADAPAVAPPPASAAERAAAAPVAATPKQPSAATAKAAPAAKPARTPRLNSPDPRCADIIARASLGETPTAAERALLQGECRP
ncbi:MAG: hypothetical protein U1E89_00080 [Burkholderiaceae bacterium]